MGVAEVTLAACAFRTFVKTLKRLPPSVFWPRPKVMSAIVKLSPDPAGRKQILDRDFFHDFVTAHVSDD